MTIGMLVWCTITITINLFGVNDDGYTTVAEGKVLSVQGEDLVVDFSSYAKKHGYIGKYNFVHMKDYECTKE